MGSGVSKQNPIPNLQEFKLIASEYDKLKAVGLSTEELHMILRKRMEDPQLQEEIKRQSQSYNSVPPSKGDGTPRSAESTNELEKLESDVHESKDSLNVSPTAEESQGPTGLVLLIDDSPVAARVAAKVLQQLNFEVITASSAKMGFDILKARCEEIILVFLDVVMPHVDGVECLSWIKENADVSHIPVYMLSGLEDQLLADVCQERGAEGMLLKPLNQKIVIDILKNHDIEVANNNAKVKNRKQGNDTIKSSDAKLVHPSTVPKVPDNIDNVRSTNGLNGATTDSYLASVNSRESLHRNDSAESKSSSTANNDRENSPNFGLQRRNSTLSTAGTKIANRNLLSERCQAPAFKLCDSDMKVFSFPGSSASKSFKHTYYAFIPSFFCSELYEEKGFLSQLFDFYDEILARKEEVVCISGDLPFALNAAKLRFNIPFTLLSDASLFVSQRFIGTVDIGSILARPTEDENTSTDHSKHIQNSSLGPHLGILYIHNKSREILKKWVSCDVELGEEPLLTKFPTDILTWTNKYGISDRNNKSKKEMTNVRKKSNDKTPTKDHGSEPQTALKLLMVDDSSVSSRVASKKLEAKGYDVTIAYNGQIAYDILKKDPKGFNIVLTDVVMPVCDGMELLRLIKADEELLHLPVFMLSGLEGDTLSKKCLQAGAAMLLKKPFNDEIFHDFVQKFFVENS